MKLLIFLIYCFFIGTVTGQNITIVGGFNDEYIIWDTCNLIYGKELSRGHKNDSCLILRYVKSITGTEWLKVKTADTIGFAIMDFIAFDKEKIDYLKKNRSDFIITAEHIDWLSKCKSESIVNNEKIENEKAKKQAGSLKDFKLFISKNPLFITSHSFTESEFLKYPSFNVSIFNPNQKKTIKYTWFTVKAYNPVNDVVGTKTVQGIGPVSPNKFADYKFDYIFKSNVIETCKIIKIKIQYMDGSIVNVEKPEIDIILSKSSIFWNYIERMQL